MKASPLLVLTVCFSCMVLSQAFFFGDNMLYTMMMLNPQLAQSFSSGGMGGMPLFMLASGSDNMKRLGQGLMFANMMNRGGAAGPGGAPTA